MAKESKPKAPAGMPGGGSASYSAKMMRQIVESAPSAASEVDLSELPEVPMPSLEGIEINVPAADPVTEEDILERFEQLYYTQCVKRNPREAGEAIQMGDELLLDLLGYMGGKIIPFSANENMVLRLEPDVLQPGLGTQLEGTAVGDTKVVTIPFEDLDANGQKQTFKLAFVCQVKGAASLDYPAADTPEVLEQIGLGSDIQEVYQVLAERINEERAHMMVVDGMNMALQAVADRIEEPVPLQLIQDEIRNAWGKTEGKYLLEKGLSRQDQDAALEGWLADETTQATARKRLKLMMTLMAFAREDEQGIEIEELEGFVEQFSDSVGIDLDIWRESITEDDAAHLSIINTYIYIRTVAHITAHIPITYGDAA